MNYIVLDIDAKENNLIKSINALKIKNNEIIDEFNKSKAFLNNEEEFKALIDWIEDYAIVCFDMTFTIDLMMNKAMEYEIDDNLWMNPFIEIKMLEQLLNGDDVFNESNKYSLKGICENYEIEYNEFEDIFNIYDCFESILKRFNFETIDQIVLYVNNYFEHEIDKEENIYEKYYKINK